MIRQDFLHFHVPLPSCLLLPFFLKEVSFDKKGTKENKILLVEYGIRVFLYEVMHINSRKVGVRNFILKFRDPLPGEPKGRNAGEERGTAGMVEEEGVNEVMQGLTDALLEKVQSCT